MKIPHCDGSCDREGEFDCGYGVDWVCEDCLCNWYSTGGTCNPRTGVRHRYETCVNHFGEPEYLNPVPAPAPALKTDPAELG